MHHQKVDQYGHDQFGHSRIPINEVTNCKIRIPMGYLLFKVARAHANKTSLKIKARYKKSVFEIRGVVVMIVL